MSGMGSDISTNSRLSIRVTSLGGSAAVRSYCDPGCTGAVLAVGLSNPCWIAVTGRFGSNWLPLAIPQRRSSGRQTGCGRDPSLTPPVTPVHRKEVCLERCSICSRDPSLTPPVTPVHRKEVCVERCSICSSTKSHHMPWRVVGY